jgi:predicted XRE-type DNA-binding protein
MSEKHVESRFDDFLKDEGNFEEAQARAVKEVVVSQLTEAMQKQSLSKAHLAIMLKTSRSQVDRVGVLRVGRFASAPKNSGPTPPGRAARGQVIGRRRPASTFPDSRQTSARRHA